MWLHLSEVSSVGPAVWLFAIVLAISILLTLIHSIDELRGRLWRYFGAIAGVDIPDWVGVPLFFVALTVGLWTVALVGVAGWLPFYGSIPTHVAVGFVAALIGGRLADTWFSHIRLETMGYSLNPGLSSAPFLLVEGVVLAALFFPGLWDYRRPALIGLGVGALAFISVLPILSLLRGVAPLSGGPWTPGEPRPL